MEPRLDRAKRDGQGRGDFRQAELVDEAQQQHLALGLGQAGQGGGELRPRAGARGGCGRLPGQPRLVERGGAALAQACQGQVAHGGIEQGRELRAELEGGQAAQQVGERVLDDVERILAPAGHAPRQAEDPVAVAEVQGGERVGVAAARGREELLVRAWIGIRHGPNEYRGRSRG